MCVTDLDGCSLQGVVDSLPLIPNEVNGVDQSYHPRSILIEVPFIGIMLMACITIGHLEEVAIDVGSFMPTIFGLFASSSTVFPSLLTRCGCGIFGLR